MILRLTRPGPPSPPRSVNVAMVADTWLEISWLLPENLGRPEMSRYSVLLLENHTQKEEAYSADIRTSALVFSGLLPGTVYAVTVAGATDLTAAMKVSNYSGSVTVTTMPTAGT